MDHSENFSQLNINPVLIENLALLKISQPNDVQAAIIPKLKDGQDGVFVAPTGTGKTLTYLLPIVSSLMESADARALVLAPTREVADQVSQVLQKLLGSVAMKTALIVGGPPMKEQTSALKKNPRVIIATPGRMVEHLKTNKLWLQNVKYMVIDEADRMLELGFIAQIESIRKTMRGDWQTMLFSATCTDDYLRATKKVLKESNQIVDLRLKTLVSDKLKQKVYFVDSTRKRELLLSVVQEYQGRILVFSYDQYVCADIDKHLRDNGVSCDAIHGQQSSQQRIAIMNNFRDGKYRVLVTTDLLARGLDIPDIECVINFDLPEETENFLHRIGRTARAGKRGNAVSLVAKIDLGKFKILEKHFENAEQIEF